MDLYGIDWAGSIVSLVGLWFFSQSTHRSRMWGWYFRFAGVVLWGLLGLIVGSWAMIGMNVFYLAIAIRGLSKESKHDLHRSDPEQ